MSAEHAPAVDLVIRSAALLDAEKTVDIANYTFSVKAIEDAATKGCCTVDAIGKALGAGTNCGSCVPELRRLIVAKTSAAEREHEHA